MKSDTTYIEKIYETAQKTELKNWNNATNESKVKYLSNIAKATVDNYIDMYVPGEKSIDAPNMAIDLLPPRMRAILDDGKITLNRIETATNQDRSICASVHESIHFGQYKVAELSNDERNREVNLIRSALCGVGVRKTFGIPTNSRVYIHPPKEPYKSLTDENLRRALYRSSFIERQAHQAELKIAEKLDHDVLEIKNRLNSDLTILRDRYDCHLLTKDELYELIDRSQENIAFNLQPTSYLEASITYDMAALIYAQSISLYKKDPEQHAYNCAALMSLEYKEKMLAQHGFNYSMTMKREEIDEIGDGIDPTDGDSHDTPGDR